MSPKVAVKLFKSIFNKMHDVMKNMVDIYFNYIGDSIMIVFGAPDDVDNHEQKAVKYAVKMNEPVEV